MTTLSELARAKLNLTLRVLGRRADGFHEIESLVAFTGFGDELTLEPGSVFGLKVDGPFASQLSGPNLIEAAAKGAKAIVPEIALGQFSLRKTIPVAAGLGGGSADAAAALRLIARANPRLLGENALLELAAKLGSDVTACLMSTPLLMTGRGERVAAVAGMPPCGVVLANPRTTLGTAGVYAALAAPAFPGGKEETPAPDFEGSFEALIEYAGPRGNELEPAALKLEPAIGEVLDRLGSLDGARLARLSGSGPTCFALFASAYSAKRAAALLSRAQPSWWVTSSTLGGSEIGAT